MYWIKKGVSLGENNLSSLGKVLSSDLEVYAIPGLNTLTDPPGLEPAEKNGAR